MKKIDLSNIKIKAITANETIAIRHAILRKGQSIEACTMPANNLKTTFHFGLFYKSKLVAVASFMKENAPQFFKKNQYRLRGMAVLEHYQGHNFGKQLLQYGEDFIKEKGNQCLWFNARIGAVNFYKINGFKIIGTIFNIQNVGEHYLMYKNYE